jgi:light-regulated signal transduction histidine kinase (bacteriophytochrome)
METLIKDLLNYSATIHTETVAVDKFEMSEAVGAALKLLESRIRESGATIVTGPLPEVAGESTQFTQVFQNLLSNAMKYRSKLPAQIRIDAGQEDGAWTFSVSDNGIGIHADYHETIFHPFKRLHGREYQGSGVGAGDLQENRGAARGADLGGIVAGAGGDVPVHDSGGSAG